MFTDEMLCIAAAESNMAFMDSIEKDYNPDIAPPVSKTFERKIRKLCRKANHPVLYRSLNKVASVILALLITGSAWLAVDVEARAAFTAWVREVYENSIVYQFFSPRTACAIVHYELTSLPDGYEEVDVFEGKTMGTRIYAKDLDVIALTYQETTVETITALLGTDYTHEVVKIGNIAGDFYCPADPTQTNELIWVDEEASIAFQITSYWEKDDMIELAASITRK